MGESQMRDGDSLTFKLDTDARELQVALNKEIRPDLTVTDLPAETLFAVAAFNANCTATLGCEGPYEWCGGEAKNGMAEPCPPAEWEEWEGDLACPAWGSESEDSD